MAARKERNREQYRRQRKLSELLIVEILELLLIER